MIEWKPIAGYEGLYEVSNTGLVRSSERSISKRMYGGGIHSYKRKGRIMRGDNAVGYVQHQLSKDGIRTRFKAHRLVAMAFIPNPEGKPWVNHIDSNPQNNNVDNLEWCTCRENVIHAIKAGRFRGITNIPNEKRCRYGEANKISKLTREKVNIIRSSPENNAEMGRQFGVSRAAIRQVRLGNTWK